MGFFGKLFGGEKIEYPALDPSSSSAQAIGKYSSQVDALAKKIDDRFEAVPHENALFVFLGKPPGMFGIVWFIAGDSEEHNMKKLMAKKGLPQRKIDQIMEKLRTAYTEAGAEARFTAQLGGKQVIVTPSETLAGKLYSILHMMDE